MDFLNNINIDFLIGFLKGIQNLIGDNCEIVVNDFRKGPEGEIVYSINSEISNRIIGDHPRGAMFLHFGKDINTLEDNYVFFYNGYNNKKFKSSTTLISDKEDKVIGSICINLDVTETLNISSILNSFLKTPEEKNTKEVSINNIDDVLIHYIDEVENLIGKKMILMNKEEKIKSLAFLDQKGIMKIAKANVILCEKFGISKFTLYNYLDEVRKK